MGHVGNRATSGDHDSTPGVGARGERPPGTAGSRGDRLVREGTGTLSRTLAPPLRGRRANPRLSLCIRKMGKRVLHREVLEKLSAGAGGRRPGRGQAGAHAQRREGRGPGRGGVLVPAHPPPAQGLRVRPVAERGRGRRRARPVPQRPPRQQALTWPPSEPPSCGSETNAWLGAVASPRPPRVRRRAGSLGQGQGPGGGRRGQARATRGPAHRSGGGAVRAVVRLGRAGRGPRGGWGGEARGRVGGRGQAGARGGADAATRVGGGD